MQSQLFLSSSILSIFTFCLIMLFFLPKSQSQDVEEDIRQCFINPFDCGDQKNLTFPFWKDDDDVPSVCRQQQGFFELTSCDDDQQPPFIRIGGNHEFRLISFNLSTYTTSIARNDLWENICPLNPISFTNITLDPFLHYSPSNRDLTFFYNCSLSFIPPHRVIPPCSEVLRSFYADDLNDKASYEEYNGSCDRSLQVKVNQSSVAQLPINEVREQRWRLGFDVVYDLDEIFCQKCRSLKGKCSNLSSNYPICKTPGGNHKLSVKFGLAVGGGTISLLITCIIIVYFRKKIPCIRTTSFLWKFTKRDQDIEAFIRNNGSLAPKRYGYSDIKKMTNSFKEKLGKGGYGSVYKGKLLDGRLVAVKVLNTSKGNGQEFINEVASISRTSHVNVVTLLGFCLEGGKRALIYEFMPNGSLDRFIYKETTLKDRRQRLTSQELYQIAIGIARGLEYLHRGCNTRILHFDIKPHNILLDENLCPKISDFGLAKLCTTNDSIVSMLEARGTVGYIAPEVFCRNFGAVSHKSDVYSYGMMILEMVGGRRNIDVGVSRTSEIYFPHWIYPHLEQGHIEPELLGLMTVEETEIARKMILVGLWCIQTNSIDRPSMNKVIEMLEGKTQVLQIPPKP